MATGEFLLFPINPKQLAPYREAVHPSGGKVDPGDAELLPASCSIIASSYVPGSPTRPRRAASLTWSSSAASWWRIENA